MSLPQILAAMRPTETASGSGGFTVAIPENWMQGRTSYGGLSGALALEASRRLADDLPPLRSATVNFVGPLAGEVAVRARFLRRGRNASWVSAEVESEAGVGLTATFVFMGPVESKLHLNEAPAPAGMIAPEDATPLPTAGTPGFTQHFERRFAVPKPVDPRAEIAWWVRLRETEGLDPMVSLMACADALPPAVMPLMEGWSPISSMTWLINLLTPAPVTRDGWWLVRAAAGYAENGCSSQEMAIWNADGQAIVAAMQAIAVFG